MTFEELKNNKDAGKNEIPVKSWKWAAILLSQSTIFLLRHERIKKNPSVGQMASNAQSTTKDTD